MRESQNVGFGRFRDGITENRQWAFLTPLVRWMDCRCLEIQRGTFKGSQFRTHFRKKLEVGNPWCGVRAPKKPLLFGGWDSNFGNSILNNFLPENYIPYS